MKKDNAPLALACSPQISAALNELSGWKGLQRNHQSRKSEAPGNRL
jgi:hypothetical protein